MNLVQRLCSFGPKGNVLPASKFSFFADLSSPPSGTQLPENTKTLVIAKGEHFLKKEIPILPAWEYMAFYRDGNRSRYESLYFERREGLFFLTLSHWIEGGQRFLPKIVDFLWAVLEETTWILPAHSHSDDPLPEYRSEDTRDIDLFSAETGSLLAWVVALIGTSLGHISKMLLPRIRKQVYDRLLTPFSCISDLHWMGTQPGKSPVNNWNPWILSNILTMIAVFSEKLEERETLCARASKMLACFPACYHSDGGCDEGPSYWGKAAGSLFDCCELLYDLTGGTLSLFDDPLLKAMGEYIQKAHICGRYVLNFADAPGCIALDGALIARYGRRCGAEELERFGAQQFWDQQSQEKKAVHTAEKSVYQPACWSIYRELKNLFPPPARLAPPSLPDAVYLDGVQVFVLRETHQQNEGFYLAGKGGHNAESHNHNDVGTFVVYHNGAPLLIDLGVGTYTRFTFQRETRYQIFTMNSSHHNLPEVNSIPQMDGPEFHGQKVRFNPQLRCFSLDISTAYPPEAGIVCWNRSLCQEGQSVWITEQFQLKDPSKVVLHLISLEAPQESQHGWIFPKAGIELKASPCLKLDVQALPLEDFKLSAVWGSTVFRLALFSDKPVKDGNWGLKLSRLSSIS